MTLRRCQRFNLICVLAALVLHVALPASANAADDARPNILLIVADDLGYADIGAVGSEIETPNIDSIAKAGVLFTQFHTANMCAPTRAMLMSGNNNHVAGMARQDAHGVAGNPVRGYEAHLSDRIVPFPQLLRDSGYQTYMAGKWHLGLELEHSPQAAGFVRSWALLDGAGDHFTGAGFFEGGSTYRENESIVEWPEGAYSTDFYTDKLIEYIRADVDDGKPFFAFAAYTSPHWPLAVPDEYLDLYRGSYDQGYDQLRVERFEQLKSAGIIPADATFPHRNNIVRPWDELSAEEKRIEVREMELYAAMVDNLDDNIGRLLHVLRDIGEFDNTIIIFMGDNGAAGEDMAKVPRFADYINSTYDNAYHNMGKPGSFVGYGPAWAEAGSAPFSRTKGYSREGGITAPFIISGPGLTGSASIDHSYFTVMDLAPTFLEIAGTDYPAAEGIEPMLGKSLVGYLAGNGDKIHGDDELTVSFHWGNAFLRQGDWKIVTLDKSFDETEFELFNIAEDSGETIDLSQAEPEKFKEMLGLWNAERRRLGIILPQDL